MEALLQKIASYNIFNYLLPGVLFGVFLATFTDYPFRTGDILMDAFLFYFFGLVISRIGSLIIEPFLKKIGFVKFADYSDFVRASKNDGKIEALSESNNMYRTFSALFLILILFKAAETFNIANSISVTSFGIAGLLFALFLWSYRKQTNYIFRRITNNHG